MVERRRFGRSGGDSNSSELAADKVVAQTPHPGSSGGSSRGPCLSCTRILLGVLGLILFVWAYPSPIKPVSFRYSNESCPEMVGPLAVNDLLKRGERLFENEIFAPEALLVDKDGFIYSGLGDGHIIKIDKGLKAYTTILRTGSDSEDCGRRDLAAVEEKCGRPLGMVFNNQNEDELFVADSSLGLLKVNVKSKSLKILIPRNSTSVQVNLLNDLVQLPNGSLLITDSSLKFSRHDNLLDVLECSANGQLIRYEPQDDSVHVVLRQLHFPNGLCLNEDRESVMVVETTRARILRYYFAGKKAGSVETFVENLVGWPDNISPSSSGGYWIGIALVRSAVSDFIATHVVSFRSFIAKFHLTPVLRRIGLIPEYGLVLEMDKEGKVVRSLHDKGGDTTTTTSHIVEAQNTLLIGSYQAPYLLKVKL